MALYRTARLLFMVFADDATAEAFTPRLLAHCKSGGKMLNSPAKRGTGAFDPETNAWQIKRQ